MNRNFARDVTNTSTSGGFGNLSLTATTPSSRAASLKSCKTPASAARKTPANAHKTPCKTPATGKKPLSSRLTPSRNPNVVAGKTPGGGDRFIANRSSSQWDLGYFMLMNSQNDSQQSANGSLSAPSSPNRNNDYQRQMRDQLNGGVTNGKASASVGDLSVSAADQSCRILAYQKGKAPLAPQGYSNNQRVLYSTSAACASSCKKSSRHIPSAPEKILDAPEIQDDYYLNLLDWSANNVVAVALGGQLYLWNAAEGEVNLMVELEDPNESITSVSWGKDGNYLAVGLSTGAVELYDAERAVRLRSMTGHADRVGALSWNSHVLSSGCRTGLIRHDDVRVAEHVVATAAGHTQEVCGLRWSPDGRNLASGGNDNQLLVWPQSPADTAPIFTLTDHQAAVKALAWCPWQPRVLASGGGTSDRTIRFWNVQNGQCVRSTDVQSQVCSLLWSSQYKELISGHGYPSHQLTLWKYPDMSRVSDLTGHTSRVLHMAMSPCGEFVMSAAADESLRLWRCFGVDPAEKKRTAAVQKHKTNGLMARGIR